MDTEVVSKLALRQKPQITPLKLISDQQPGQLPKPTAEWRLQLSQDLQASLDPLALLETFSRRLGEFIKHDGLSFQNNSLALPLEIGERNRHRLDHRLGLDYRCYKPVFGR